jgi:hypothetical protein
MNIHVKPTVTMEDVDIDLLVLGRLARTLCHLAEDAQQAIAAAKRMKMAADFDYYDDLVMEQAYVVKCGIEDLRKKIGLETAP